MRKLFFSALLVALGAGVYGMASRTMRFSTKQWDASFENVLRHQLTTFGITDHDLVSSVHEVRKDRHGDWVTHRITLDSLSDERKSDLAEQFRKAGATVDVQAVRNGATQMVVKRGGRIYHEITFPAARLR